MRLMHNRTRPWQWALVMLAFSTPLLLPAHAASQAVDFEMHENHLEILLDGQRVATYAWADETIPRPYFCNIMAPNGDPVTRNHPVDPVVDASNDDHPTYHPGIWLAFGDLGGADFWRNRALVVHGGFVSEPRGGDGVGRFEVRNRYETHDDPPRTLAEDHARYTIRAADHGYLIEVESFFTTTVDGIAFGDQEEMGFGIRLATALTVKHGNGSMLNSEGERNESGTWGRQARWCAGMASNGGIHVGAVVMASPENFRESWFHSRDYGLIVANPFGKKAMTAPNDDEVPGDSTPADEMHLNFAVGVFSTADDPAKTIEGMYAAFTRAN